MCLSPGFERKWLSKAAYNKDYVFNEFKDILQFNPNITIPDIKNVLGKYVDSIHKYSIPNIHNPLNDNNKIPWLYLIKP